MLKRENFLEEYQCGKCIRKGNFITGLKATTERAQCLLDDINTARLSTVIRRPPEADSRLISVSGKTKESAVHLNGHVMGGSQNNLMGSRIVRPHV